MKVIKDDGVYKVVLIDGKYYAWSKTGGGDVPVVPDTPTEPDVPVEPDEPVILIGNVQNNDGVLTGFDADSYAIINYEFPETYSTAEIVIHATAVNFNQSQGLFSTDFLTKKGMSMGFSGNNVWYSLNGTNFSFATSFSNLEYWWKYTYDGEAIRVFRKTADTDYEELGYRVVRDVYGTNGLISLGKELETDSAYWLGSIVLNDSYIKVDDVVVWEGTSKEITGLPKSNIELVGNTKTAGGYLWDFDADGYGVINYQLPNDLTKHEFEIVLDFYIYNTSTKFGIFDTNKDNYLTGLSLSVTKSYLVWGSGDGTTHNFGVGVSQPTINGSRNYKIKITNKGYTEPNVIVEDVTNQTTTNYGTIPSPEAVHGIISLGMAGTDQAGDVAQSAVSFLNGYFNLNNCYIEIDGVKAWEGVKT